MIHALKTETQFFEAVASGEKSFEVRSDDRPYVVGDFLALNEWSEEQYTGRCMLVSISYILREARFCKEGYCIMGVVPCSITDRSKVFNMMNDTKCQAVPIYGKKREKGERGHERNSQTAGLARMPKV